MWWSMLRTDANILLVSGTGTTRLTLFILPKELCETSPMRGDAMLCCERFEATRPRLCDEARRDQTEVDG